MLVRIFCCWCPGAKSPAHQHPQCWFNNQMVSQERRLKHQNTLRGLEISKQHQIVNALELSSPPHPHPPPQKKKKKLFMLVISLVEKNWLHCETVTLWNSLVTWKLAQNLSDVWKPNSQVCHLWLFCWYCLFAMCIRTNIHGSVAFPVLLPIDIENPHHYGTNNCWFPLARKWPKWKWI